MKHSDYLAALEQDPLYIEGQKALKTRFTLGDAILRARLDLNWSQAELAKQVGTRQANISRIEAGTANPTLDLVHRLLDILNLTILIVPVLASPLIATSNKEYYDFDGNIVEWPSALTTMSTADNTSETGYQ